MCSVGDLKNNLRILQSEARQMKYGGEFDLDGLTKGNPHALLPLYNYAFTTFNSQFSAEVIDILDDNLYMKSDVRFMESVYRILRDVFHFKPSMTKEQFFTVNNFAERKIIMCVEVLRLVQQRCRFLGPKNPTNPHIKVSSVVDNRRCSKKSSTDLVTAEPSGDVVLTRKVSDKGRVKPLSAYMAINEKDNWQLKVGYFQPRGDENMENGAKEDGKERTGRTEREDHGQRVEKSGMVASVVREFSPASVRNRGVEVVHMPHDKHENGHLRVADMLPKSQSQPQNDWDPTGAVECILAKVRDLPAQLTNFMKAVEGRLQKIEERLDNVESVTARITQAEGKTELPSDIKHEIDTLQARLLLLENRVTLTENKTANSVSTECIRSVSATEDKKMDFAPSPFVSLERGEDLFSGSLMDNFSPIRQDMGDYNRSSNNTLNSIADGDNRRSSTPNQSSSARPPPCNSSKENSEKRPAVSTDTTLTWENLDASTQQQVERINGLLKATQVLLPNIAGQGPVDT